MTRTVEFEQWIHLPVEQVFLFFADPRNLPRIMPPELEVKLDEVTLNAPPAGDPTANGDSLAGVGSEIVTSVRVLPPLPFRVRWVALITEFEWNHHFADLQKTGPFKNFHHRHEFAAAVRNGQLGTTIRDVIRYEVGYGWLGSVAEKLILARAFPTTFLYRQRALERLLGVAGKDF